MGSLLIIDPDPATRRIFKDLCGQWSVRYMGTPYLEEGREIWQSRNIDLMVLELFLPEKSGLSFVNEVTSQEPHPTLIVTFSLPKIPQFNIYQFTRMLGVAYTLPKPLDPRILQGVFRDLVPQVCDHQAQLLSHHQYP